MPLFFAGATASGAGRLRGQNSRQAAGSEGEMLLTGPQLLGAARFEAPPPAPVRYPTLGLGPPTGAPTSLDMDVVIPPVDSEDDDRPCAPPDC